MRSGKGDLFHKKVGQNLDKLFVAALIQLWLVHELGLINVLVRVLVSDGEFEVQC